MIDLGLGRSLKRTPLLGSIALARTVAVLSVMTILDSSHQNASVFLCYTGCWGKQDRPEQGPLRTESFPGFAVDSVKLEEHRSRMNYAALRLDDGHVPILRSRPIDHEPQ